MNYPRYKPASQRTAGRGAFSDYTAFALRIDPTGLKASRIDRKSVKARALALQRTREAA
jgi:hypothetical protein